MTSTKSSKTTTGAIITPTKISAGFKISQKKPPTVGRGIYPLRHFRVKTAKQESDLLLKTKDVLEFVVGDVLECKETDGPTVGWGINHNTKETGWFNMGSHSLKKMLFVQVKKWMTEKSNCTSGAEKPSRYRTKVSKNEGQKKMNAIADKDDHQVQKKGREEEPKKGDAKNSQTKKGSRKEKKAWRQSRKFVRTMKYQSRLEYLSGYSNLNAEGGEGVLLEERANSGQPLPTPPSLFHLKPPTSAPPSLHFLGAQHGMNDDLGGEGVLLEERANSGQPLPTPPSFFHLKPPTSAPPSLHSLDAQHGMNADLWSPPSMGSMGYQEQERYRWQCGGGGGQTFRGSCDESESSPSSFLKEAAPWTPSCGKVSSRVLSSDDRYVKERSDLSPS
jgi:hypothetical protein